MLQLQKIKGAIKMINFNIYCKHCQTILIVKHEAVSNATSYHCSFCKERSILHTDTLKAMKQISSALHNLDNEKELSKDFIIEVQNIDTEK